MPPYCDSCPCSSCLQALPNIVYKLDRLFEPCSQCSCVNCSSDKDTDLDYTPSSPQRDASSPIQLKGKRAPSSKFTPRKRVKTKSISSSTIRGADMVGKKVAALRTDPISSTAEIFCVVSLRSTPGSELEMCHVIPRRLKDDMVSCCTIIYTSPVEL